MDQVDLGIQKGLLIFKIVNNSNVDTYIHYLPFHILMEGNNVIDNVAAFDATQMLGKTTVNQSPQTISENDCGINIYFLNKLLIPANAEKRIWIMADILNLGKIQFIMQPSGGIDVNNIYGPIGNTPHRFNPIKTGNYSEVNNTIGLGSEETYAINSNRFAVPIYLNCNVNVKAIDLIITVDNFIFNGYSDRALKFTGNFDLDWQNQGLTEWHAEARISPSGSSIRLIAFGQNPIYGNLLLGYVYVGFEANISQTTNQVILLDIGYGSFNDAIYPSFNSKNILTHPPVNFGDVNLDEKRNSRGTIECTTGDIIEFMNISFGQSMFWGDSYLKSYLAADLDGNKILDSEDMWNLVNLVFNNEYLPPISWHNTTPTTPMGNIVNTPSLTARKSGNNISYYLNADIPITNGDLYIEAPITASISEVSKNNFSKIGLINGKQCFMFSAMGKYIDQSQPLFTISNATTSQIKISGKVNHGIGIKTTEATTAIDNPTTLPSQFDLLQNYPNPFNPSTTISYSVLTTSYVTLKVFDILGKMVAELVNETKNPGNYQVKFNADELSSGIYLYQFKAGEYTQNKKMQLIK